MRRTSAVKSLALALFLGALLAAFLSAQPVALADDTSIGATGGTVYPIWMTDVRLAAETVQATCFGSFVEYRVDFKFVNDGKARTIKLGFPFNSRDWGENGPAQPVGFQAWREGEPLSVRAVPARYADGAPTSGYFVHKAYFPAGATAITVSYLAESSGTARGRRAGADSGDPGFGMAAWYEYWLHTGSTWKGPIGEAVVRYRLADTFAGRGIELTAADADEEVPVTAPEGWTKPLPRTYQWRFVDFEPRSEGASGWWEPRSPYDITLGFANVWGRRPTDGKWTSSSTARVYREKSLYGIRDGSLGSCWIEGVPGPGVGEWVEARFKRPQQLRELRIVPGNNEYLSAFTRYARPKTLRAVFSDGSSRLLHFRDAPTLQRFPVDVKTKTVRLVVESVYLGTDYPATCIAEVELGTERAPGYAPFRRLIDDSDATGRLPAWAGPAAPAPESRSRRADSLEKGDAESVACGDLIGVDQWEPFPADDAPFKEPAELADIVRRGSPVPLPDPERIGEAEEVNALSAWTYEVRYSSGIDLLVNTALRQVPFTSVLAELDETDYFLPYEDQRALPYDVQSIGDCVVGVARPGVIVEECACPGDSGTVPGQVFWRDRDLSYHLFARSEEVTTDELVEVATSLIDPSLLRAAEAADSRSNRTARAWVVTLAAVAIAAAVFILAARRRKVAGPPTDG